MRRDRTLEKKAERRRLRCENEFYHHRWFSSAIYFLTNQSYEQSKPNQGSFPLYLSCVLYLEFQRCHVIGPRVERDGCHGFLFIVRAGIC